MQTNTDLEFAPKTVLPCADSVATLFPQWRQAGVWLSLWDPESRPVMHDEHESGRAWSTLLKRCAAARKGMTELVTQAIDHGIVVINEPWCDALQCAAIPVRERSRVIGVLVAGWRVCDDDETLARLCDSWQLDFTAISRMIAPLPRMDPGGAKGIVSLIELTAAQAIDQQRTVRKIESFTRNLNDTYEELNLVYSLSSLLGSHDEWQNVLTAVADEMRTVSRARCVAVIVPDNRAMALSAAEPSLLCIRSGDCGVDDATLMRLANALGVTPNATAPADLPPHAICNDLHARPELEFVADSMAHAVGLPMVCDGRWLGTVVAIDRDNGEDFSSIETKLLRAVADRVLSYLESQQLYDDLAGLLMGMLHALVSSIDAKDPYTCGHSARVAALGRRLAQEAGLSNAECHRVYLSGLLHDVGKIGIPDAILCKPGRLTDDEFNILRKHPETGARILTHVRQVQDLIPGVLHHHERFDGRGYPHRLSGHDIPALGRILCIADCFDAMTSNRTYRSAMPVSVALAEVRRCSGTQFDPQLAELFLRINPKELMLPTQVPDSDGRNSDGSPLDTWISAMVGDANESLGNMVRSWQRLVRGENE